MNKAKLFALSAMFLGLVDAADYNVIVGDGNIVQGNKNNVLGNKNDLNGDQNTQVGNQTKIHGQNNTVSANNQRVQGDNQVVGAYDPTEVFFPSAHKWPTKNLMTEDNQGSNINSGQQYSQTQSGNQQTPFPINLQQRRQQVFQMMIQRRKSMGLPVPSRFTLPPA